MGPNEMRAYEFLILIFEKFAQELDIFTIVIVISAMFQISADISKCRLKFQFRVVADTT